MTERNLILSQKNRLMSFVASRVEDSNQFLHDLRILATLSDNNSSNSTKKFEEFLFADKDSQYQ